MLVRARRRARVVRRRRRVGRRDARPIEHARAGQRAQRSKLAAHARGVEATLEEERRRPRGRAGGVRRAQHFAKWRLEVRQHDRAAPRRQRELVQHVRPAPLRRRVLEPGDGRVMQQRSERADGAHSERVREQQVVAPAAALQVGRARQRRRRAPHPHLVGHAEAIPRDERRVRQHGHDEERRGLWIARSRRMAQQLAQHRNFRGLVVVPVRGPALEHVPLLELLVDVECEGGRGRIRS